MEPAERISPRARLAGLLSRADDAARSVVRRHRARRYVREGRVPWTRGYAEYRAAALDAALSDAALRTRFAEGAPLPVDYGISLDARVIEIPWAVARLGEREGAHLLDAGSALNHGTVLAMPAFLGRNVTILTLAPEPDCYWSLGVSYQFGDLRGTLFRDGWFDEIVCISTIEHVGLDNTMYAGSDAVEHDTTAYRSAIQEFRRILKPGGRLLLTVPFGRYEDHGWFQQFDRHRLDDVVDVFRPSANSERIYRYDSSGWQISQREDAAGCAYFDVHSVDASETAGRRQAAEGAVACLELVR